MVFRVGLSTTVLHNRFPNKSLDGIGVYTQKLKLFLAQQGCEIQELSFPQNFSSCRPRSLIELPYSLLSSLAVATGGHPLLAHGLTGADIFHATDYRVLPMKIPVVATLHDAIPMKNPAMANSKLRSFKNYLMRSVAQFADQIVTVSNYAVSELEEYYRIPKDRIKVVHNGVDDSWFEPADRIVLKNILSNRGLDAGYFLTVGTLQPRKNIDRLIDAYLSMPKDVLSGRKLVIIGKKGWQCQDLVKRIKQLSGGGVVWLDNVTSEGELKYLFSGAEMFIFPSLYEGFGLPILEAFARKKPVIASNNTSLPEVGGDAALYFDPSSTDELRFRMLQLLGDEFLSRDMIERGFLRAKNFTWGETARNMIKVYQTLV